MKPNQPLLDGAKHRDNLQTHVSFDVFRLLSLMNGDDPRGWYTVAHSLASGTMCWVIETCHNAFELGQDVDEQILRMMAHVFEARLAFLTKELPEDVVGLLELVDELHKSHQSAVLMVDEDVYEYTSHNYRPYLTGPQWWCAQARLDASMPDDVLEALIRSCR